MSYVVVAFWQFTDQCHLLSVYRHDSGDVGIRDRRISANVNFSTEPFKDTVGKVVVDSDASRRGVGILQGNDDRV